MERRAAGISTRTVHGSPAGGRGLGEEAPPLASARALEVLAYPTLTTGRLRALFTVLRKRGVDLEGLLRPHGIDIAVISDPLHRMPRQEVLKVLGFLGLTQETGELGIEVAEALQEEDLDLLGHLLATAPTLGAALDQGIRYMGLLHDGVELELRRSENQARILHRIVGGRAQWPMTADFAMATLVRLFREMTGGSLPLSSVKLARPRPPRPAYYRKWFATPVSFDAECNELRFPIRALEHPLPRANASLHAVLERQARAMLSALPDAASRQPFAERVRRHLQEGVDSGEVSVASIAQRLCMAERTLRRRLEASGTSLRDLLDDVRREHALVLMQDPALNLTQVAHRLGFSGPTSFGRAFLRWTGTKPKNYTRRTRSTG